MVGGTGPSRRRRRARTSSSRGRAGNRRPYMRTARGRCTGLRRPARPAKPGRPITLTRSRVRTLHLQLQVDRLDPVAGGGVVGGCSSISLSRSIGRQKIRWTAPSLFRCPEPDVLALRWMNERRGLDVAPPQDANISSAAAASSGCLQQHTLGVVIVVSDSSLAFILAQPCSAGSDRPWGSFLPAAARPQQRGHARGRLGVFQARPCRST